MVGSERPSKMETRADAPGYRGLGPAAEAKDMRLVQENSFGFLGMARIPSGRSIGGDAWIAPRLLCAKADLRICYFLRFAWQSGQ